MTLKKHSDSIHEPAQVVPIVRHQIKIVAMKFNKVI